MSYSAFDRELFGVYAAIRHFRHHLEGRLFTIWTDHKPLTFALSRMSDSWTARQQRQLSYVAEFTNKIVHVPGRLNIVADLMSRPPQAVPAPGSTTAASVKVPSGLLATSQVAGGTARASTLHPVATVAAADSVDLELLAKEQGSCPTIQQLLSNTSLQIQTSTVGKQQLLCDVSSGRRWPLVPSGWRRKVFLAVHTLAHPGIRASRRLLSSRFVWKGMAADVGRWCRECQACQKAKITTQPSAPVQPIPVPSRRVTHIHVDLVGLLTASAEGFTHVLTIVDRTTQVDGGTSAGLNNSNSLCGCPGGRLDLQIRCSGRHHNGQGCAVHLGRLAGTLQATGHRTFSNNSLPPAGQWLSGALPPSTQGLHAGPAGRQGLASTPPLGPAGPSGSS